MHMCVYIFYPEVNFDIDFDINFILGNFCYRLLHIMLIQSHMVKQSKHWKIKKILAVV